MKTLKKSFVYLVVLTLVLMLCSCGGTKDSSSSSPDISKKITDRMGEEVEIPQNITKIVSLSASNTEILTGLGLKDKIVATDIYSADAGVDSSVAILDMQNPDIEKITSLSPDVVFVNGINTDGSNDPYTAFKKAGLNVVYIPAANSLEDIVKDITFISEYTKTEAKGKEFTDSINKKIDELKETAKKVTEKKKVYVEISAAPYLYSCGSGTYINEILELLGAENIFSKQNGWLNITEENVISENPDIILSTVKYDGYDIKEISQRKGWDSINAVKNNEVKYIDTNAVSRASQNVVKGIDEIKKAVYPDL